MAFYPSPFGYVALPEPGLSRPTPRPRPSDVRRPEPRPSGRERA